MLGVTQVRRAALLARLLAGVLPITALTAAPGCAGKADRSDATGGAPSSPASGGAAGSAKLPDAFGCQGEALQPGAQAAFCAGTITSIDCTGPTTVHLVLEGSEAMQQPWGNTTRWQYVRAALSHFGKFELFAPTRALDADVCEPASYASPLILDASSNDPAPFLQALDSIDPLVETQLLPALDAALARTRETRGPVIVLTARAPDECASDDALAELTRLLAARGDGVVFVSLDANYDVDPLSRAASTLPFRIGPNEPVDRLVEAVDLSYVCGGPPRAVCGPFDVPVAPPELVLDLDNVRFGIETQGGAQEFWPTLSGPDACASSPKGGSYLDTSQTPNVFRLCPCSCARMTAGTPVALFGCKP